MHRSIILVGLMCVAACGGSSGSTDKEPTEGTASATGQSGGWTVSVRAAVATTSMMPGSDALILLTDSGQACTDAKANVVHAGQSEFTFELNNAEGGLVEGTYAVGRSSGLTAMAVYLELDHDCLRDTNAPEATSGTVTLTKADLSPGGAVEGTFVLTFPEGSARGFFSAQSCDIPMVWEPPACL